MATKMANLTTQILFLLCLCFLLVYGKKHKLTLENESRRTIDLSTFGFLQDGFLQFEVKDFTTGLKPDLLKSSSFGFTVDKMKSSSMSSLEDKEDRCLLTQDSEFFASNDVSILAFKIDFVDSLVKVERKGDDVQNLTIFSGLQERFDVGLVNRERRSVHHYTSDSYLLPARRRRQSGDSTQPPPETPSKPKITATIPTEAQETEKKQTEAQETEKKQTEAQETEKKPVSEKETPAPGTGIDNTPPAKVAPSEKVSGSASDVKAPGENTDEKPNSNDQVEMSTSSSTEQNKTVTLGPLPDKLLVADTIPITILNGKINFQVVVEINKKSQEGQYKLTFHNCHNTDGVTNPAHVNFTIVMIEKNGDNYLSAGHIPLPMIYFLLCVVFLGLACAWLYILKKSTEGVYKMHYLMLSLVYIKSLALLFHAINYHFLATQGHHEEAIAIIYYITYLMRGILLFVTIILIGAGWAFVKHILSDRDKKIFLIIIPLQVLANVAQIFIEETEEGESQYLTWNEIFIIVDLLCCGAILFPVVWSIRHLQEASQTDGKVAINLVKLKLFRHFYILIVCYIYFTRIIIYLLRIAVPFQYEWMDDLFRELATLIFYVVTGYKFRPASDNPYLQVPQDSDDEVEMDEVITQSGATEGLTKVNVKVKSGDGGDTSCGVSKRESSHDYD